MIAARPEHEDLERLKRTVRRTMAAWAQDLLVLRARGLHRPGRRRARRLLAAPARRAA